MTAETTGLSADPTVKAPARASTAGASRIGVALAAVVGFACALTVLYPGQYPFDSAYQLWQARHGIYSNITPVPMIGLWSLLLHVFGNPASLLCLNLALFWAGLGLCFQALPARAWVKVSGVLLTGLNPLALVQMAHLLSDAHMTALLALGAGLLVQSLRTGSRMAILAACLLLVYAGTIRQNALVAIVPFGPLVLMALKPRWRMGTAAVLVSMIIAGTVTLATGMTLDRMLATERRDLWPMLALWDLAAISVATGELLLPPFTHGAGLDVEELRETGAFNPVSVTSLFSSSRSGVNNGFIEPYSAEQRWTIAKAWWKAIADHPFAYLSHRGRTASLLFGRQSGQAPHGIAYYQARTDYRDNPPLPAAWFANAQGRLYRLADQLSSTWLFSALPLVLLNAGAFWLAWRRRGGAEGAFAAGISASALLYAASFLPLAPSAELRYLTWPIIAALPAVVFAFSARSGKHGEASTPLTSHAP
ncbi:hypothetical protein [Dokdonella immobilis]|uniref:hypothetical protein n=1 Tax=Dokdonella immobilis TaxID=578942 RepID=UPI001114007A|nr:hypothetical protein [Dokdonella immobilis]